MLHVQNSTTKKSMNILQHATQNNNETRNEINILKIKFIQISSYNINLKTLTLQCPAS